MSPPSRWRSTSRRRARRRRRWRSSSSRSRGSRQSRSKREKTSCQFRFHAHSRCLQSSTQSLAAQLVTRQQASLCHLIKNRQEIPESAKIKPLRRWNVAKMTAGSKGDPSNAGRSLAQKRRESRAIFSFGACVPGFLSLCRQLGFGYAK